MASHSKMNEGFRMNSEAAFNFREVLSPRFKHPTYLHNQWGFWCRRSCLLLLHTTGCFADRHYESRIVLVKRFYRETSIVMYGWQLSIRKLTSKTDYTRTYNEPTTDGISLTRFGVRSKGGGAQEALVGQRNFPPTATKTPRPPSPNKADKIASIPNARPYPVASSSR